MVEVICISDNYSKDKLEFWSKYGITYPKKDELYTISEVIKHNSGDIGCRVQEIENPPCPIKHSVLGIVMYVPTFALKRFAKLSGDKITKEEIEEIIKETQKI